MKNKIIFILFIINSLVILSYIFPFQDMIGIFFKQEAGAIGIIGGAGAIGIIGGADGPTAIFISSKINWYIVVLIVLEIVFVTSLLLTHLKKNKLR